ncbi:MAG: hypothetical protein WKF86_09570 [Acidimicrobiales bacterium]
MCTTCMTNAEAIVLNTAMATGAAVSLARRVNDALRGVTAADRQVAAHAANARFVSSLGHDPVAILGPPPQERPATSGRALRSQAGALAAT